MINNADVTEKKSIIEDKFVLYMLIFCFAVFIAILIVDFATAPKLWEPVYEDKEEIIVNSGEQVSSFSSSDSVFPIKINTATSEDLQQIPDIGPKTAQLILDYREVNGTIVEFEDLISVDGIGKKTVENIKKYCVID